MPLTCQAPGGGDTERSGKNTLPTSERGDARHSHVVNTSGRTWEPREKHLLMPTRAYFLTRLHAAQGKENLVLTSKYQLEEFGEKVHGMCVWGCKSLREGHSQLSF